MIDNFPPLIHKNQVFQSHRSYVNHLNNLLENPFIWAWGGDLVDKNTAALAEDLGLILSTNIVTQNCPVLQFWGSSNTL